MKSLPGLIALWASVLAPALLCAGLGSAHAADTGASAAADLRAKFAAMQDRLSNSPFRQPLYMESSEQAGGLKGEVYALVDHPFATAGSALSGGARWCDVLMLHLNTKSCGASSDNSFLQVHIGKKHDQPLEDAHRVDFAYRVAASAPDYLRVVLTADEGPLSTRDYRIVLEAVPAGDKTFIHFTYSYALGVAGRLAIQAYLGTSGSDKVGFTVAGKQPDGSPLYVGGMRGLVERNTMRYYLAIESYLGALSTPPQARLEKRLNDWFTAVERYPRQLHELERAEYLAMKRREHSRQQAAAPATPLPGPDA